MEAAFAANKWTPDEYCPPSLEHVWEYWQELTESHGGFTYAEVAAWAALTGRRLSREEVALLFEITRTYRASKKNKGKTEANEALPDNVAPADNPEAVALSMRWAALDAKKRETAKSLKTPSKPAKAKKD